MSATIVGVALGIGVAWAYRRARPTRIVIEGDSMRPTLLPGDWALAVTPSCFDRGDVVVLEHPGRPGFEIVKRLAAIPGDEVAGRRLGADEWWVLGDDADRSTDSRRFGPVPGSALRSRVALIYWPPVDRGFVR